MPSPPRLLTPRFVLVVAVGLAYFLSIGMLLPIVPLFVKRSLEGGDLAVGVAVGSFAAGAVLLRPIAGRLGDRFGRRVLIIFGSLLVSIAVAAYHLADGLPVLVAARLLGGAGEAAFFVGAGTMVTDLAPETRRGEALSYWSIAVYGGLAFGPSIGELVLGSDRFGLVWTVSAGLALLAAVVALSIKETLVVDPDAPPRPKAPLIHRASLAPGLVLFLGLIGLAGFVEFVPLYVHEIGMPDSKVVFLVYGCTVLAVRIIGARIPDRVGPLRAGAVATVGVAVGLVIIAAVPQPAGLFAGTFVFSIGMSLLYPALMTLALTGVPASERGSAVGTVSSFFDASQGLGAVILGGVAALSGYRWSFLAAAALALVGLVLLVGGIDPRTRRGAPDADVAEAADAARRSLEPEPT